MESNQPQETPAPVTRTTVQKVWDIPTRLVHWALAIGIAVSWWTAEIGVMEVHYWSGLTLLGLLVFRVYWGFAGPETARFSHFIKGPATVFGYVPKLFSKDYRAAFGHNPIGALSVVALLLAVIVQVGLGLFATDTSYVASGPLNHLVDSDTADEITDLHEDTFNVVFALILVHLAAIAFYLIAKRINLIGPMISGRRRGENLSGPATGIEPVPVWRLLIGIVLAIGVVWFLAH